MVDAASNATRLHRIGKSRLRRDVRFRLKSDDQRLRSRFLSRNTTWDRNLIEHQLKSCNDL